MMRFLDVNLANHNMDRALVAFGEDPNVPTRRERFFAQLSGRQGVTLSAKSHGYIVDFDADEIRHFVTSFGLLRTESDLSDRPLSSVQRKKILAKIEKADNLLNQADPPLKKLLDTVLANVAVFVPRPHSDQQAGSVSSAIGMIYLCPQTWWSYLTFAEMMLHEATHNVLFLDDLINLIFPNLPMLGYENALVTSALRRTKRPYDKSFHSACVSATLCYFYGWIGRVHRAAGYLTALRITVRELLEVDVRLRKDGIDIITDVGRQICQELKLFANLERPWIECDSITLATVAI